MNRTIQLLVFLLVFVSIYLGMHAYVFFRLGGLLSLEKGWLFYAMMLGLAFSFPLTMLLEKLLPNILSRILYSISATWFGILFLLFCATLVFEGARFVIKLEPRTWGLAIVLIVLCLSAFALLNALFISTKEISIPVEGLADEIVIVQLSDLHMGTVHNSAYLKKIVGKTNSLSPDAVMLTGDFFDGSAPLDLHQVSPIDEIEADVFFVTGNHERYEGIDQVLGLISQTKARILMDEMVEYKGIQLIGLADPEDERQQDLPLLGKMGIDKDRPAVLLNHKPIGFDDSIAAGIDLQLSGHTHSGQIFPFNFLTRLQFRHTSGLYEKDGRFLYVSSGAGTWGPPMRLGSRSEIVLIRLVPKG